MLVNALRLLVLDCLVQTAHTCIYPAFLQSEGNPNRRWMYHIHNQGARAAQTNLYVVTFNTDVMEVVADVNVLDPPGLIRPYRRQCLKSDASGFITSHEYSDQVPGDAETPAMKFLCVQFTTVSPYVVLVSEGVLVEEYTDDLCVVGTLTTDYWPMVSFLVEHEEVTQYLPDALLGGYHFSMTDAQTGHVICAEDDLYPSRLDVACSPDNHMIFSFSDNCGHSDLKMINHNFVYSLGHWHMLDSTFMVIKSAKSLNLWCLRLPKDINAQSSNFTAQLFLDVECDPRTVLATTTRYLELEMQRTPYNTLCQDISTQCSNNSDVCNSGLPEARITCLETCDTCNTSALETASQTPCNFSDVLHTAWIHAGPPPLSRRSEILVIPSKIFLLGIDPLVCMETSHPSNSRYPLVYLSNDGCFPRFICVEFTIESPGFVSYQLGWPLFWPTDMLGHEDPYDIACGSEKFVGRYDTDTNRYRVPETHSLIHDPRGLDAMNRTSNCFVGNTNATRVSFERLPGKSGEQCQGVFSVPCGDPAAITIESSTCSQWPLASTKYHCMASVPLVDDRRIVVTVSDSSKEVDLDDMDFRCWMFSDNMQNLYVVPWADCGQATFDGIVDTDMYRDERDTFVIDVSEDYDASCDVGLHTDDNIQITIVVEVDTTTYTFVDPVGSSSRAGGHIVPLLVNVFINWRVRLSM